MKKLYFEPELEVVRFTLTDSLMTPSIETDQSSWAGGSMDPGEAEPIPIDDRIIIG